MIESLGILFVAVLVLVGIHRWVSRRRDTSGQRQKKLIQVIMVMNVVLILLCVFQGCLTEWYGRHPIASSIYVLIAFNAFAYSYFHLFNMSETARRIRILREIADGNLQTEEEIQNEYSAGDMIKERLVRLQDLGQIKKDPSGNYRISGYSFIFVAKLFRSLRKIVLGQGLRA